MQPGPPGPQPRERSRKGGLASDWFFVRGGHGAKRDWLSGMSCDPSAASFSASHQKRQQAGKAQQSKLKMPRNVSPATSKWKME